MPQGAQAMRRSIRPTTATDAGVVVGLLRDAGLRPSGEPQELVWKYWLPRADWPGARSFVLTEGAEPIAHAALIPGWCRWQAQRVAVIHLIDWAARGAAAGAGVALLKHIGRQAALLAIGGSAATLRILPEVGFRRAGVVTGYVRTLFPLRLLRERGTPLPRRLLRCARSLAWALAAPRSRDANWQVRRLSGADVSRIADVLPRPARGMAVIERSVELFHYVLACPVVPLALFAVEYAGRTRGYFMLAAVPGQVRIVDCWIDSDEAADWRAMILCAVEQARLDAQAAEVVIWANDPLLAAALTGCGFHARCETPVWLRPTDTTALPPAPLRVQMLDNDAAFLHEDRAGHWA